MHIYIVVTAAYKLALTDISSVLQFGDLDYHCKTDTNIQCVGCMGFKVSPTNELLLKKYIRNITC